MPSQKWWTLPAFRVTASVALALNHACSVASASKERPSHVSWTAHSRRGGDSTAVGRHLMSEQPQPAGGNSASIARDRGQSRPASPPPPPLPLNVVEFGAKGDNHTDNTAAFRAALAACSSSGGGTVMVPPGLFVLAGNLTIPPGVTLRGTYSAPPSHDLGDDASNPQSLLDGSVLIPTGGRHGNGCAPGVDDLDCTAAFVTITQNAAVCGLVVWYKQQERVLPPVPYPWTFRLGGVYSNHYSNNAALFDVEILGAWNGVAAVHAGRHYIARVQGQPLNIGLFVDEVYDIGRIENVHWVPWYSQAAPLIYHQTTFGRAFVFGRTDWQYVFNTFAYAYAVGYHFIERPGGSAGGQFLGIGADAATNASVLVESVAVNGVLIANGEFTAFCDQGLAVTGHPVRFCPPGDTSIAPVHVRTTATASHGSVKFSSSSFWGPAAMLAEAGGGGTLSFVGCRFDAWDNHLNASATGFERRGTAAMTQSGGALVVSSCEFSQALASGFPLMTLKPGTRKTVVTGNVLSGVMNVSKAVGFAGKAVVANNVDDS